MRGLARLTLLAAAYPPFCVRFHTNSPIEVLKHFGGARNTEMTGEISAQCVHDPQSSQKRHMDADGIIEGGLARTPRVSIRYRGDSSRFVDKENSIAVSLEQAAY